MQVAAAKSGDPKQKSEFKNIPRIGKLPDGSKRGFMTRLKRVGFFDFEYGSSRVVVKNPSSE